MTKVATKAERAVAADEAQERSLSTGEVLRERGLCPLVVVRTRGAGVHIGLLAEFDRISKTAVLLENRRLWRWYGANTLNEVATKGVSGAVRLSEPVDAHEVFEVTELLPVSESARESLTKSRWL